MPKLNDEGLKTLQRLEEAEASGKVLNEDGKALKAKLSAVRDSAQEPAQADPAQADTAETMPVRAAVSKAAHAVLPVAGGAVGVLGGIPTTPAGQVVAGGLGIGGGIAAADLLDRLMQYKKPPPDLIAAIKEGGEDAQKGLLVELGTRAAAKMAEGGADAGKAFLKENLPKIQQALSGVRARYFSRIAEDPSNLLPQVLGGPAPTSETGPALGRAQEEAFGEAATPNVHEVNDPQLGVARKNSIMAKETLDKTANFSPKQKDAIYNDPDLGAIILKGKRGTQAQLDSPSVQGSQRALLEKQKAEFDSFLNKYFPDVLEKSRDYARSITRESVAKLLPVLKNGDPSISRMFIAALGGGGAARYLGGGGAATVMAAQSPIVNAFATAAASMTMSALKAAAQNPLLRQAAVEEIARRQTGAEAK